LRLLTDRGGLDRPIRCLYTTDLPDPSRYLSPGVLVLTGMIWCREPGDADKFVGALARAGAGALCAGEALGDVPADVVKACGQYGVTLLAAPAETSFAVVSDEVGRRLNGDRASAMTKLLGQRRLLLSAVAEGAGLTAMFRLVSREIGTACWLLTATGRIVAGTGGSLDPTIARQLAGEYLRAGRLPAAATGAYSLFPVGAEPRITSWLLAVKGAGEGGMGKWAEGGGQLRDWQPELRESVTELAADLALERARLDAGLSGERRLGERIVARLASGATDPGEIASLMRAAELPPGGCYVAIAMRADGAAGKAGTVAGWDGAQRNRALLEELVLPEAGRAAIASVGDETFALVPRERDSGGGRTAGSAFAARVRDAAPQLEAGLPGERVTIGVSTLSCGIGNLAGALQEARSARRIAELRPGSVCVVTGDEVDSHDLLLASVPGGVLRSFRERLLGPLTNYDDRHRAELVPTLREFLECSGSWNSCASKMYVHVNTVRYRIRRIEELTGRDLSSLADRVDFYLALRIR
jgi:hypothetical protein